LRWCRFPGRRAGQRASFGRWRRAAGRADAAPWRRGPRPGTTDRHAAGPSDDADPYRRESPSAGLSARGRHAQHRRRRRSSASSGMGVSCSDAIHTAARRRRPAGRCGRWSGPSGRSACERARGGRPPPIARLHEPVEVRIDGEGVGQGLYDFVEVGPQADDRRLSFTADGVGVHGAQTFSAMRMAARQPARTTAASKDRPGRHARQRRRRRRGAPVLRRGSGSARRPAPALRSRSRRSGRRSDLRSPSPPPRCRRGRRLRRSGRWPRPTRSRRRPQRRQRLGRTRRWIRMASNAPGAPPPALPCRKSRRASARRWRLRAARRAGAVDRPGRQLAGMVDAQHLVQPRLAGADARTGGRGRALMRRLLCAAPRAR